MNEKRLSDLASSGSRRLSVGVHCGYEYLYGRDGLQWAIERVVIGIEARDRSGIALLRGQIYASD